MIVLLALPEVLPSTALGSGAVLKPSGEWWNSPSLLLVPAGGIPRMGSWCSMGSGSQNILYALMIQVTGLSSTVQPLPLQIWKYWSLGLWLSPGNVVIRGMADLIFGSKINCWKKSWSLWFPALGDSPGRGLTQWSRSRVPLLVPGGVSGISWGCLLPPSLFLPGKCAAARCSWGFPVCGTDTLLCCCWSHLKERNSAEATAIQFFFFRNQLITHSPGIICIGVRKFD